MKKERTVKIVVHADYQARIFGTPAIHRDDKPCPICKPREISTGVL